LILQNREALVDRAARHKISTVYPIREFAAGGGSATTGVELKAIGVSDGKEMERDIAALPGSPARL
jgi:hypothetical protein